MIGESGKTDGSTRLMLHKTESGIKIGQNYLKKMAMDGGGYKND